MMKPNFTGTINDTMIKDFCKNSLLITDNYEEKNIKQACYELTAGNIYYDLENPNHRIDIEEKEYSYILIKPNQTVVVITNETLKLPNYVIGRILSKGKLFSLGLLPVNTYADPGFEGKLGIVLHNSSTNYLKIKKHDSIAKIEFSILHDSVISTYSGQHGYSGEMWPIPFQNILNEEEIKKDKRIDTKAREIERMYGSRYSKVIKNILRLEKTFIVAALIYFTFILILIGFSLHVANPEKIFDPIYTILFGLLSNIISFFIIGKIGK